MFKIFQFVNETLIHTNWEYRYFIWRQHHQMWAFHWFKLCMIRNIIKITKVASHDVAFNWPLVSQSNQFSATQFNRRDSIQIIFFVFFPLSRRSKNFSDDRKSGIQVSVWIWQWKFRRPGYVPSILSGELFFSSLVSKYIKCFQAHFHLWDESNGFFFFSGLISLYAFRQREYNPIALRQT